MPVPFLVASFKSERGTEQYREADREADREREISEIAGVSGAAPLVLRFSFSSLLQTCVWAATQRAMPSPRSRDTQDNAPSRVSSSPTHSSPPLRTPLSSHVHHLLPVAKKKVPCPLLRHPRSRRQRFERRREQERACFISNSPPPRPALTHLRPHWYSPS